MYLHVAEHLPLVHHTTCTHHILIIELATCSSSIASSVHLAHLYFPVIVNKMITCYNSYTPTTQDCCDT